MPNKVTYSDKTQMWELGGIYNPKFFGYTKDGLYQPNPLVYPDFIAIRDGQPVRRFLEAQNEILIVFPKAPEEGSTLKVGNRTVALDPACDWVKVDGLNPGEEYHFTYSSADGQEIWGRDIRTKTRNSTMPLLNVEEAGDYRWIQVLNLPDDASSVKILVDGQETGAVTGPLDGKSLSAEITYADSSVETVTTEL